MLLFEIYVDIDELRSIECNKYHILKMIKKDVDKSENCRDTIEIYIRDVGEGKLIKMRLQISVYIKYFWK